jgi:hypothetical protein
VCVAVCTSGFCCYRGGKVLLIKGNVCLRILRNVCKGNVAQNVGRSAAEYVQETSRLRFFCGVEVVLVCCKCIVSFAWEISVPLERHSPIVRRVCLL